MTWSLNRNNLDKGIEATVFWAQETSGVRSESFLIDVRGGTS